MHITELAEKVTYKELEGDLKLVEVRFDNEDDCGEEDDPICVFSTTDKNIKRCIEESKRLGDYGEYGEHFAELCAHNFAYTSARQAYFHFYNSTGYILYGGEYPNTVFYIAQEAVYNYVLPIFRSKIEK